MTHYAPDFQEDAEEPQMCSVCSGTGMSAFGPPDVGRCYACGGTGEARERDSQDDEPCGPDDGYADFERDFGSRYA